MHVYFFSGDSEGNVSKVASSKADTDTGETSSGSKQKARTQDRGHTTNGTNQDTTDKDAAASPSKKKKTPPASSQNSDVDSEATEEYVVPAEMDRQNIVTRKKKRRKRGRPKGPSTRLISEPQHEIRIRKPNDYNTRLGRRLQRQREGQYCLKVTKHLLMLLKLCTEFFPAILLHTIQLHYSEIIF